MQSHFSVFFVLFCFVSPVMCTPFFLALIEAHKLVPFCVLSVPCCGPHISLAFCMVLLAVCVLDAGDSSRQKVYGSFACEGQVVVVKKKKH